MKLLRETIRRIILEDRAAFEQELSGNPNWDVSRQNKQAKEPKDQQYKTARKMGRTVKKAFNNNVNREFLDSLIYVHWVNIKDLQQFLEQANPPNRDELSTAIYENGKIPEKTMFGNVGVVIDGYVTLAGNNMNKMYTGNSKQVDMYSPQMKQSSGVNKGVMVAHSDTYILDKDEFNPSEHEWEMTEALLDNWQPIALVTSQELTSEVREVMDALLMKGIHLPIATGPNAYL